MGKISLLRSRPLVTIHDQGRFGFRKYGIPQSGAVDKDGMHIANGLVGNKENAPIIEFAIGGMSFETLERTAIGVFGAGIKLNGKPLRESAIIAESGSVLEISSPKLVYGYLAIGGKLQLPTSFNSFPTYLPAKFGGIEGRSLRKGDVLQSVGVEKTCHIPSRHLETHIIKFIVGPEWEALKTPFEAEEYQIDPSSNRIGTRLIGESLECTLSEIKSSAVVPGTIQLPPNGQPIVLMNDCQTTGGYPRIGKVLEEDLGKLGQARVGQKIRFEEVSQRFY